jgi:hypothetical protein
MLGHIAVSTASAADSKAHIIIIEVFFGELSEFLVECGRKHHVMMIRILIHILLKSELVH